MYISINVTLRGVGVPLLPWRNNKYHILCVCVCVCVCVLCPALVIDHAMHAPYYTVICGLSDCTIFFHIIS